jgi:hypothetical protein
MPELFGVVEWNYLYAWMLIACMFFSISGDRIERRLCRGGRGIWVSGGRWPGTSPSRQAIYLCISESYYITMHFSTLVSITMHCFCILLCPLCSNSCRLSSTSRVVIISKEDTFNTYSLPLKVETRWLASKSLGNTCSGAKNSRIGNTLSRNILKMVLKTLE